MTTSNLTQTVIDRRANCHLPSAITLAALFGLFASVPMSIRQRDWKIWLLPFLAGATIFLMGSYKDTAGERAVYKFFGWGTQAALVGVLLHRNKEDALGLKQAAE
jgi:hypothetical protein